MWQYPKQLRSVTRAATSACSSCRTLGPAGWASGCSASARPLACSAATSRGTPCPGAASSTPGPQAPNNTTAATIALRMRTPPSGLTTDEKVPRTVRPGNRYEL